MILAETSGSSTTGPRDHCGPRVAELIDQDGPLATTEPVVMEVLAGARDDRREAQLRAAAAQRVPAFDPVADFDAAARIYRRCRAAGVTPRGMVDCMIAAVAWRRQATLLAQDADLDRVAAVLGIAMDKASLRA